MHEKSIKYDLLVLGFGKGGKTLAAKFAKQGKKVALVEQDPAMYGGTCINIGCIPTKVMLHSAFLGHDYDTSMKERVDVTTRLRAKNRSMIESASADLYTATAKFISNKEVQISSANEVKVLTADTIAINVGAVANVVPIPGLSTSKHVYDSTQIQTLPLKPKRLVVIGGGNIGLEFATFYAKLGTQVRVLETLERILPQEEEEVAFAVQKVLEDQGIEFVLGCSIVEVNNPSENSVAVVTKDGTFESDALLYSTGRKANTHLLGLESTQIELNPNGSIKVDEFCQTSVEGVFALGDVNGGPQFTYVSLDDFRIVDAYLRGETGYSLKNRRAVPIATFIDPPFARVGINQAIADRDGIKYKVNSLPVSNMPRGHVNGDLRGMYKVLVDPDTNLILGATFFGAEAHELINLITMAIDNKIPYTYLKNQIFTHPTMAENLNDLFNF